MVIQLVTFDLDDTLWNNRPVILRAVEAQNAWVLPRVPEYEALSADEHGAIRDGVIEANPGIVHDMSAMRETVLRETFLHCGYPADAAARLAADAFAVFLDERHHVDLFPDTLDVLGRLAEQYTLAALTDGNADYRRLGLDRFFAFGYCAADVGARKPHPAIFERAIARAGVAPGEAVHVGDHQVDIQGARDVGMRTVWVNLTGSTADPGATATVTALADVPDAIAALDATLAGR